ncbi:MAG: CHAT domain-containing protein [Egibacteraceae bacterium]
MLSACETAAIGTSIPDEAVGLPTGLLHAGAAAVVGSLWAVPDAATSLLTRRFYDLWRGQGLDPATALRRAQQWMRDSTEGVKCAVLGKNLSASAKPNDRRHQSPYWWAAFTLTGC